MNRRTTDIYIYTSNMQNSRLEPKSKKEKKSQQQQHITIYSSVIHESFYVE